MLKQAVRRVKWEQRTYWRNPQAAAFTFAFPLMFLVVFIAINGNARISLPGGTVRFAQYYVPAIVGFGIVSATYSNLGMQVTFRRQAGMLKRTRGTPLAPAAYIMGMVGSVLIISLMISALTIGLGIVAYGVTWPGRYLGLAVTLSAAAFCFSALGVAVSTFVRNEDAGPAVINFILFPVLFISGTFGRVRPDTTLTRIADLFPVRHVNELMIGVFNPFGGGSGIVAGHLLVILAWGTVALLLAARRFRWEPYKV